MIWIGLRCELCIIKTINQLTNFFNSKIITTMKKITFFAALFFAVCAATFAQTSSDGKALAEVYNQAMKAFEKQDAQALTALFTNDAEHITPLGGIVRGKEALQASYVGLFKMFAQLPKPDRSTREVLNMKNRYITPDLLLSTYTEKTTSYFGTKANVEEMTSSVLLSKKGDKWLIESLTLTPVTPMPDFSQTAKK
jgi:uncharacterized protein (TIGR02246 family)